MTADERRRQVLAAAIGCFAHGGLHGTSTEDIAKAAGISHPYLFRLFPTKKDLFLAAVEETFGRARQILLSAAGDSSGQEALKAMGLQYRKFLEERTLLLTQMHAFAACDDPDVRALTQSCFGKLWGEVADVSGATDDEMVEFFAAGMLLNVAAAMDLDHAVDVPWIRACLGKHSAAGT